MFTAVNKRPSRVHWHLAPSRCIEPPTQSTLKPSKTPCPSPYSTVTVPTLTPSPGPFWHHLTNPSTASFSPSTITTASDLLIVEYVPVSLRSIVACVTAWVLRKSGEGMDVRVIVAWVLWREEEEEEQRRKGDGERKERDGEHRRRDTRRRRNVAPPIIRKFKGVP